MKKKTKATSKKTRKTAKTTAPRTATRTTNGVDVTPIEGGLPIPAKRGRRGSMFPFEHLEIDQSFAIKHDDDVAHKRAMSSASNYARRVGIKLAVRRVPEGTRIWRTA